LTKRPAINASSPSHVLDRAQPGPEARDIIVEALRAEAAGGPPTGLGAAEDDGALTITYHNLLLHASRD